MDERIRWLISIHALREEGDITVSGYEIEVKVFLSTPSARRATEIELSALLAVSFLSTPSARRATREEDGARGENPAISIHALREEGDAAHQEEVTHMADFYPRPPRGGRHDADD